MSDHCFLQQDGIALQLDGSDVHFVPVVQFHVLEKVLVTYVRHLEDVFALFQLGEVEVTFHRCGYTGNKRTVFGGKQLYGGHRHACACLINNFS